MTQNLKTIIISISLFLAFTVSDAHASRQAHVQVAIFPFYNFTRQPQHNILQYSLREKLIRELDSLDGFAFTDNKIIQERVLKKNLSLRDNMGKPSLVQYIGGLVQADILIAADILATDSELVISASVLDAAQGSTIRRYRITGNFLNIDAIIKRLASDMVTDITTWRRLEEQLPSKSIAQTLGTIVAEAEEEDPMPPSAEKDDHTITWETVFPVISAIYYRKSIICSYMLNQVIFLTSGNPHSSIIHQIAGFGFLIKALNNIEKNDLTSAEQNFATACGLLPENKAVLARYAEFLHDANRLSDAMNVYLQYIQHFPDDPLAYIQIANIYMRNESYFSAIYFLELALSKQPNDKELYSLLAKAYALTERMDDAINTLKKGLRKFPEDLHMTYLLSTYANQVQNSQQINK
ncbi:MAG: tetratricopeptide repeat protein [Candidatus Auribacterota bacterium]